VNVNQLIAHRLPGVDDLAVRLRQIRLKAQMSQRQLSAVTGISIHKVGNAERGTGLLSEAEVSGWAWQCGADDQVYEVLNLWRAVPRPEVEDYADAG
jgi:DNA-binding XRE family transcriptional regulator